VEEAQHKEACVMHVQTVVMQRGGLSFARMNSVSFPVSWNACRSRWTTSFAENSGVM